MARYPEVEALLNDYFGLDVQSIGHQRFERATESRMSEASHGSYSGYLKRLRAEEDERIRLLDLLVVPETWFFRDSGTFAFLADHMKREWRTRTDRRILSILSAPCATGEEPYSIAMTLLDAGLDPSQFRIYASDISPKVVAAAKEARYGHASFRTPLTAAQDCFFVRIEERSTVCEAVRSSVSFSQGNLIDANFMADSQEAFDIIFCKNVMIYLGQSGRAKVVRTLTRLLKETGLLFVGHSEVALFEKAGYTPVRPAKAFGLTKTRQQPEATRPRRRLPRSRGSESGARPQVASRIVNRPDQREEAARINSIDSLLATARTLADRGDLREAARLCRCLIGANSMDVGAYYLAGLIEQSLDHLEPAEDLFLKAIYLDPDHYDTLLQLCLLSEKKGDSVRAGQYRKRLLRLEASAKRG